MGDSRKSSRWKPGESGNPAGKKPGTGKISHLRDAIATELPEILHSLIRQAKAGDVQAAKILLEKVLPSLRATEATIEVALSTGDPLSAQARSVLHAVANGEIAPGHGAQLMASLGMAAKIGEMDELVKRVEQLEGTNARGA
ncbi:hypothetical protein G3574_15370 [Noviherbaspirillum sp. 17J57-3]|uniref:DUF5681 domain-containing protein n=2 Tax=Noviherbaspirillum galbum TaxID=2709383 RepID=A0A6B3SXH7_9BURK|nr:hypothetical protein [Noviherbaspirillum galbum]